MRNEIDKIFDDNLRAYSSAIPDGTWQTIQGQINTPAKGGRWIWLLLIFIGLSFITAFLLYPQLTKKNSTEDKYPQKEEVPIIAGSNEEQQEFASVKDVIAKIDRKESVSSENRNQEGTLTNVKQELLTSHSNKIKNNQNFLGELETQKTLSESEEDASTDELFDDNTELASKDLLNSIPKNLIFNKQVKVCEPDFLKRHIYYVTNEGNWRKMKSKTLGDCFDGPNEKWLMAINTSLDYPFRSLSAIDQGEYGKYLNERDNTESELLSFNIGFQVGYIHPSGFLVKSGTQYTHINERFLFVKENVIKIQTQITIDTMYHPDGSFSINRDTTINEIYGREEMKTINQYRMVDIPLVFGYRFKKGNFNIEINGGIIFNLSSQTSGRIFNSALVPVHYGSRGTGSFNPYKIRFGTSLYGGATILTHLWGRSQFFLEPNVRYYLKSFSNDNYPLKQKYFVIGLSTGVRYYF